MSHIHKIYIRKEFFFVEVALRLKMREKLLRNLRGIDIEKYKYLSVDNEGRL